MYGCGQPYVCVARVSHGNVQAAYVGTCFLHVVSTNACLTRVAYGAVCLTRGVSNKRAREQDPSLWCDYTLTLVLLQVCKRPMHPPVDIHVGVNI
jgi:hypothetical protein